MKLFHLINIVENQSKILLLIFYLITRKQALCDICELCNCTQQSAHCDSERSSVNQCFSKDLFKCDGNDDTFKKFNQTIQLDNVEWPNGRNVAAAFNNLNITFLTKIFCSSSSNLTEINLDHNFIESQTSDPFQYCKELRIISISYNLLQRLTQDFLKSVVHIERLNLSYNALVEFHDEILSRHTHLIELDLSHNQITTLKLNEIMRHSNNIRYIDAAFNELFVINSGDGGSQFHGLQQLNLAGNKLTVLTSSSFVAFPNLQYLDLSANELSNIEEDTFDRLNNLQHLDLSRNKLKEISLKLTDSIKHISLSANNLNYWPMKNVPINLDTLEMQSNNLEELVNGIELPNVTVFNISNNYIEMLPSNFYCPNLKTLDMSHNRFTEIPAELGRQAPSLDWLRMNSNPIEQIKITKKVVVRKLELSGLLHLKEFDASQFNFLDSKNGCMDLTISHCPELKTIRNSFGTTTDLCSLDLSYNALSVIDEHIANWSFLSHGINLQGNPFQCTCKEAQWILDTILPNLYNEKRHQRFLRNLRCASPPEFAQHRLLRYYNHEKVFCRKNAKIERAYFGLIAADENESMFNEFRYNEGLGLIVTISLLIIIFLTIVLIVIALVNKYRMRKLQKNNRRYDSNGYF